MVFFLACAFYLTVVSVLLIGMSKKNNTGEVLQLISLGCLLASSIYLTPPTTYRTVSLSVFINGVGLVLVAIGLIRVYRRPPIDSDE